MLHIEAASNHLFQQCVPNYPDKNLPTVFCYRNGQLAIQWIGGGNFGRDPKLEEIEWMLHEKTIITSDLENDPRKKTEDMFTRNVMSVSIFRETINSSYSAL